MTTDATRIDPPDSARRHRSTLVAGVLGVVLMVAAAVLAPAQPELVSGGGACQLAPCGTLEDLGRWHAAWWCWAFGAILAYAGVIAGPRRTRSVSLWWWLLLPPWLLLLCIAAVPVSWATSVQGAATVLVVGTLPLVLRPARRAG